MRQEKRSDLREETRAGKSQKASPRDVPVAFESVSDTDDRRSARQMTESEFDGMRAWHFDANPATDGILPFDSVYDHQR